ncbi:MAG: hypothetical protein OEY97_04800 [Nitrospirota bacterium]|nr:hypothetical protein [Nitrospirota bacterium]
MKTVLVILDGAADEPSPLLCGKTPLHAAPTPHLDRMAATGAVGWLNPTPAGQAPGSEAGIPALLGVESTAYGRAAVEAEGRGIQPADGQQALRASLVRVSGPLGDPGTKLVELLDGDAGDRLARNAARFLDGTGVSLYPGTAGRNIMVTPVTTEALTPPHPLRGLPVSLAGQWPCRKVLEALRVHLGGVTLWPWGGGAPFAPRGTSPFTALVAGAELVRGLGRMLGMVVPDVPGATGNTDTCLSAKAHATLALLGRHRAVAVHVEAPDLAAHRRDPLAKAAILRAVDRELIGPLAAGIGNGRLVVTCDHGTSSVSGCHLDGPVPYVSNLPDGTGGNNRFFEGAIGTPVLSPRDLWIMDPVAC